MYLVYNKWENNINQKDIPLHFYILNCHLPPKFSLYINKDFQQVEKAEIGTEKFTSIQKMKC